MSSFVLLLSIAAVGLTTSAARAADQPAPPPSAVLHLTDGSFVPGDLDDSTRPGVFRWQASAFVSPFEFPVNRVNAIHWPPPAALPKPEGDYCFELAGGDILFGTLVALDDKQAELDIPRIGRLQVERSIVHRIYRWRGSADLVYLGPNGLAGWSETASRAQRRDCRRERGHATTVNRCARAGPLPRKAGVKNQVSS